MQLLPPDDCVHLPLEDVLTRLSTNAETGLSHHEAAGRLSYHGHNALKTEDPDPLWKKFLQQFKEPMILMLLASAVVSAAFQQFDDAVSITLAVVIVVTVAFVQEYRSDKSLEALKDLAPPRTHVVRSGAVTEVLAADIVPGDVVVLSTGDRIPADIRLIEAIDLQVDESTLTGEPEPRTKSAGFVCANAGIPLAERRCMAHMGTLVCCGRGKGVVVGTGLHTELGKVFVCMSEQDERRSPLQQRMDALGQRLSMFSFGIIGFIVLIGLFQRKSWLEMLTIGVSLAVAAIPEGLPIVVTVTLALGVMRMAKRNAVMKKLPAVESLGCTTVICVDKTGTLTRNEMTVVSLFSLAESGVVQVSGTGYDGESGVATLNGNVVNPDMHPAIVHAFEIGYICNNANVTNGKAVGQPTEAALVAAAHKVGIGHVRDKHVRVHEIPFSSDTKWMAVRTTRPHSTEERVYIKGSVETVLPMCAQYLTNTGPRPFTDADRKTVADAAARMCGEGLRVLALASGQTVSGAGGASSATFAGIVGLHDAPREGVAEAIDTLHRSGVIVAMITGDSVETAVAIAAKLNMLDENPMAPQASNGFRDLEQSLGDYERFAMSGTTVDQLSEEELAKRITGVRVFYRAVPRHKLKIVRAFQDQGHVVAMTGDGVNDAPALKAADIGIAMGLTGTDVAKEASDMVLLNDDFVTILAAIEEGKSIFYNIRNFVRFQLSTSIAALLLLTTSTVLGLPSPLNAMQILWINIIMDGPPAQSLGVEPVDHDVMRRPPRGASNPIITREVFARILTSAFIIVAGTLYMFWHERTEHGVSNRDTTLTFTTFVMFDMFNALSCRSADKPIFQIGLFSNKFFLVAVGGSLIGQLFVVYFPPLQAVFQTEAISFDDWMWVLGVTSPVFLIDEVRKIANSGSRSVTPRGESSSTLTRLFEVSDGVDVTPKGRTISASGRSKAQ